MLLTGHFDERKLGSRSTTAANEPAGSPTDRTQLFRELGVGRAKVTALSPAHAFHLSYLELKLRSGMDENAVDSGDQTKPLPLLERLRGIVPFLNAFQSPGFEFGSWITESSRDDGVAIFPYVSLSEDASAFVQAAYDFGWVLTQLHWMDWQHSEEAKNFCSDNSALAQASPEQLARLLTVCIRQDRFSEGALKSSFELGLLIRILTRAAAILHEVTIAPGQLPTREFCVLHPDGRISDAELHEPILQAGDDRAGREISRKIAKQAGLSEDQIKKMYD